MVATTLSRGKLAVIGVNTEDNGNPQKDSITFILLAPIGSGTQIFFTDRSWNGTVFAAAGGGEGTFTYTAGADLPAGTVITITQAQLTAAGINLSDLGETIYVYQGAINAPTTFLHAVEIADGNSTFNGSLVNTGLTAGTSAVAIANDNAQFGTRTNNINAEELFLQVNNNTDWVQNDNSPQGDIVGPFATAPDRQIWVAGSGAGEAIVLVNLDDTLNGGDVGYRLIQAFQNDPNLFHPSDITLDTVADKFFFVDADLNGNNRIIQGSISQVLNNPGAPIQFTVLYSNTGTGATGSMRTLSVDIVNDIIYFDVGTTLNKIGYNTANQTPTQLLDLGTNNFITQLSINYSTGQVIMGSSRVTSVFGSDAVTKNYVYTATGLTPSSTTLTATQLPFNPDDNDAGGINNANIPGLTGEGWPVERGTIEGVDIDTVNNVLYISTGTVVLDTSAAQDGSQLTTFYGGIYRYALTGNPNGDVTLLFQQNGTTGPVGLLSYIEVDPHTGQYHVIDSTGTNGDPGDGGIWTGNLVIPGTPTLLATVGNINGLGPHGLEIQTAPTLGGFANAGLAVTEASSSPNSGETARVTLYNSLSASDIDTADGTDELAGALVRISGGFTYEAASTAGGHTGTVDFLTINGTTSGTIAGSGIAYSYNQVTGQMTLSGAATTAEYAAALALVRFSTSGDNVTNDGSATTRTISASVFDGLLYSDEITATVNVTGINDAPVNTPGAGMNFTEDTTGNATATPPVNAVTGISIADADADASSDLFTTTLSVNVGTLTIRTDVTGGLTAGQVTGNGTGTITLTGTQNAINATLAAVNASSQANGLVYTPPANFNGNATLTIVTNDQGNSGNDPGLTGTGTTEQDSDTKNLNVADVNDAPTVSGDGAEASPAILEDTPFTNANAPTVGTLFAPEFSDALDVQFNAVTNPAGTSGDAFAGVAIVANGSNANGQWQYWDGDSWENIGAATVDAAKTFTVATQLRFSPALNFNGEAPTLTARLIEAGGPAIVNGGTVDLNPAPPTTGPGSVYSAGTVTLSQTITAVNDAPTSTNLNGNSVTWTEGSGPVLLDLGSDATLGDVDSANFDTGTLTVDITGGEVSTQDTIGVLMQGIGPGQISVGAGSTVTYGGVVIGTYSGGFSGNPLVVTFNSNATPAAVQSLLQRVAYNNSGGGDDPTDGNRTITWTLVDGDGTANTGQDTLVVTTTVDVNPVNDAPQGIDGTITVLEDTPHVFTALDFGFTDAENHAFAGVVFPTTPTAGTLLYDADGPGGASPIAVSSNQFISAADIAAGKLTFVPAANASGSDYATFTFKVRDIGGTANGGVDTDPNADTLTVNVTPVNDAPSGTNGSVTGTEDTRLVLTATNFGFTDTDGNSFDAVRITTVPANGTLYYDADGAGGSLGQALVAGDIVDIAAINAGQLVFVPALNGNGAPYTSFTFQVRDNGGTANGGFNLDASANTLTINISSQNDAPVLAASGGTTAFVEGANAPSTPVVVDSGVTINDVDGPIVNATVQVTTGGVGDVLAFTNNNAALYGNIVQTNAPGSSVVQLSSSGASATLAQWQNALRAITYTNTSDNPTTGDRVVTFTATDGTNFSNNVTKTLTITASNDAPVNSVPGTQTIAEDGSVTFSAANGNAVTVSDADLQGSSLKVTLSVADGTLTLGSTAGLSVTGNGTNQVTILFGSVSQVNTALDGLTYTPPANANGSRTITITTGDRGSAPLANLIVNGNAEADAGAADYDTIVTPASWTDASGNMTAVQYAIGGADDLNSADSTSVVGGSNYFAGGPGGTSGSLTQQIDVSGQAAAIDTGRMQANLSAQLGGYLTQADGVSITLRYLDGTGTEIATSVLNGPTAAQRGNQTSLLPREATYSVPAGTRSIVVELSATNAEGAYTDGYADNLVLTLSAADVDTFGVNITAVDDAAVAQPDAVTTAENAVGTGSLFADNGSGADNDIDGPALSVGAVQGQAGNVGTQIMLPSGALLTVNADGTYSYDPNGKFNYLVSAAMGTGAVSSATDSFTYTLAGGNTVTVTVTVTGVSVPGDELRGSPGDDTINGTPQGELVNLSQGGNDTANGLGGDDGFYFGAALTAADSVNGGGGTNDQVGLQGNYAGLTLGANNLVGVEQLVLLSGNDTRFGDTANNFYDYNLTTVNANVAAGQVLTVNANTLRVGEDFTFNGAAETDGSFLTYGGSGVDTITGGQLMDGFFFGLGRWGASDRVDGQGGADQLGLQGDYTITFGANQLTSIETIVLLSGADTRFGGFADTYQYSLTMNDGNVAAGARMTINANNLRAGETLSFDGSAELDGAYTVFGGAGADVISGGNGADVMYGAGGADVLFGGLGNDTFAYASATHSTSTDLDQILDFTAGDIIDLSAIDANNNTAGNDAFSFIGNAAFSNVAGQLRFENVSGSIWLVQADVDGDGIADFEVAVVVGDGDPITAGDFVL